MCSGSLSRAIRLGCFAGRLEMELSEMLGRKVDLRTLGDLSRYFRDEVVRASEVQFVKERSNGFHFHVVRPIFYRS